MKRFITAILAIIYLAISSGVIVNTHYCMGKVSGVKLQSFTEASCACGSKMKALSKCCRTELKVVKLADDQKISYANFVIQTPVIPFVSELSFLQTPFYNAASLVYPDGHSPPLISEQDTYLQNCVFRI